MNFLVIAWESSCGGRAGWQAGRLESDEEEEALGFAGRIGGITNGLGF